MEIGLVVGTRPEIIKTAPIIRELEKQKIEFFVIHTGQHYSYKMDKIFFEELELKQPEYKLDVGSASHSEQTAKIMVGIENVMKKENPDVVVVQGDTNSTLAGTLVPIKMHIPVVHIEAGVRSFDRRMPEEINRMITTQCAEFHMAPTERTVINLLNFGIPRERIFMTGNTVVDACFQHMEIAKKKFRENLGDFALMTIHRPENVDDKKNFEDIVSAVSELDIDVICPIHPRSRKMIRRFDIKTDRIKVVDPMGYLEFLYYLDSARFVLTDSGGVVEEAISLNVPSICMRDSTDRPEAVEAGGSVISGPDGDMITKYGKKMIHDGRFYSKMKKTVNPYGDGKSGKRIVGIIRKKHENGEMGINYIKSKGFDVPSYQIIKRGNKKFLSFESISGKKISLKKEDIKALGPVEKKIKRHEKDLT